MLENQLTAIENLLPLRCLPPRLSQKIESFEPVATMMDIAADDISDLQHAIALLSQTELAPAVSSISGKNRLRTCLAAMLVSQKWFNTPCDPESFKVREDIFMKYLGDHPIDAIERAFETYCKAHSDIPAPADIIALIDKDLILMKARRRLRRMQDMKKIAEKNQ